MLEWDQDQEQLLRQGLAELPSRMCTGAHPPVEPQSWDFVQDCWQAVLEPLSERLGAYARILLQWHAAFHLLGEQNKRDFVPLHLLDSVSGAICLLAQGFLGPSRSGPVQLIDVGSGLGLPGIPLALCLQLFGQMQPEPSELQVYLVEPAARRANILRSISAELGLGQLLRVCEHPVDQWPKQQLASDRAILMNWAEDNPAARAQRIVTCRAFRPLGKKSWKELCRVFANLGHPSQDSQQSQGSVGQTAALLYKGNWQTAEAELAGLELTALSRNLFELPQCDHQRSLLLIPV